MATKNLGQVAGVYIGTTPPSNTKLLWFDDTPSQQRYKVYDASLGQWIVLEQTAISSITYSELVNIAKNTGLTIGQWFKITDKGNALAISITSTKIQYCDSIGNILIDDLGTNIQYHVSSSNLTIDDVIGVFDNTNSKLVFQFNEQTPDYTADDYILGKIKRDGVWSLAKYKLSSFLSKVTGNSITWNGGFFFNFSQAIKSILDKDGGIVSKNTYDSDKDQIIQSINNVGKENQQIIQNAKNDLSNATSPSEIYGKPLPSISTGGEPVDIAQGNTLLEIISKIQRYINKFKYASGISMPSNYSDSTTGQYVNNNDNVSSAIGKLQYWIKNIGKGGKLSSDWTPQDYTGTVEDVQAGDSLDTAFAKAVAKLEQIGDISDGLIKSKQKVTGSDSTSRTVINLKTGNITFNRDATGAIVPNTTILSAANGFSSNNSSGKSAKLSPLGLNIDSDTNYQFSLPSYEDPLGLGVYYGAAAAVITGKGINPGSYSSIKYGVAIAGICTAGDLTSADIFDAYFSKLKAGSICFGRANVQDTDYYITNDCSFVTCTNINDRVVYLPTSPMDGHLVIINQVNTANVAVMGNGHVIVDDEDTNSVNIGGARRIAVFLFHANLSGGGSANGKWLFARWSR